MEKYAKKLQDIINEQDFCFEPEEIKTVEKALGVLRMYEDANIPAEACAEYRKFEDELIRDGVPADSIITMRYTEMDIPEDLSAKQMYDELIAAMGDCPRRYLPLVYC